MNGATLDFVLFADLVTWVVTLRASRPEKHPPVGSGFDAEVRDGEHGGCCPIDRVCWPHLRDGCSQLARGHALLVAVRRGRVALSGHDRKFVQGLSGNFRS
jgi:hypothetical protein